jgi:CMP-N-acetylneuraminic acid synthetase
MKTIAIIPARGGSKRLPNKNIKLFGGIPLLVHSINFAKANNKFIDDIIVSTDSHEIAKIASQHKVKVIMRPIELSGDDEPTISVLLHVLQNYEATVENVILLQPTNPLRPKKLLIEAFEIYKKNYQSLFTVSTNEQKLGKIQNEKYLPFNYKIGQSSQDLEPLYYENGLLYISKAKLIMQNTIFDQNSYPFIVNHPFAKVDIDTQEDFEYAEYLYEKFNKI